MKKFWISKLHFNSRFSLITCIITIASTLAILSVFLRLYEASKRNIINQWQIETVQAANQINKYMKMPVDAISFSAVTLNEMLEKNAPHTEVHDYIKDVTEIYAATISENSTGIYCYYQGDLLNGTEWIPPKDFNPKLRPWYTDAFEAGGKPALVKPYLDLRTNTVMVSVSQLLDDLDSVVSMDIFLDNIQKTVEDKQHSKKQILKSAFVMDRKGFIIAHSDSQYIGKNLGKTGSDFEKFLVKEFSASVSEHIEKKDQGKNRTVFVEAINSEWLMVFVLGTRELYSSLRSIYISSALVLFFILLVFLAFFLYMSFKYAETEQLNREIRAVADIYVTAAKINLKTDTITCIRSNPEFDRLLDGDFTNYSKRIPDFAKKMSIEGAAPLVKDFMELSTLESRLNGSNSISFEFIDDKERWIRLRYIVLGRDENEVLQQVLLVFESIDEDKKQQEALRKLSETDMMTGVKNRGCGELQIREAISKGKHGMFCLLDVDKFKSINDNYGHQTGDAVIIAIADCLKKSFRDSDIVFRLGGDEFAVFADGVTREESGLKILKRFFDYVEAIDIPELKGRKITVSVGATFFPISQFDTFEAMYQRSDLGTYKSKERDGNMLTFNI